MRRILPAILNAASRHVFYRLWDVWDRSPRLRELRRLQSAQWRPLEDGGAPALFDTLIFYFKGYLIVSALFSALAASLIRDGNITKTVIYAPILLLIAYTIFVTVHYFSGIFFSV